MAVHQPLRRWRILLPLTLRKVGEANLGHIVENRAISLVMLFDAGRSLEERVLSEQFSA